MQLFDLIFWYNQKQNTINFVTTKIAMIFNHLQPIVLAALFVFVGKRTLSPHALLAVGVYAIVGTLYSIRIWNEISYTLVNPQKSGKSLYWEWNYMPYFNSVYILFLVAMTLLMLENLPKPLNYIAATYTVLSLLFSRLYFTGQVAGRMWCWLAGFAPLVMLAIYIR